MLKTAVVIQNLGTPDEPTPRAVRRYLREFLMDPRVLDLPWALRWPLVHLAILPFRPAASAHAYRKIWTSEGSPLLVHTRALSHRLAEALGEDIAVAFAMRYGKPSFADAWAALKSVNPDRVVVVPLYPQFATSSTGSSLAVATSALAGDWNAPALTTVPPFYAHEAYLDAVTQISRPQIRDFSPDFVLMSYHGLPERHIRRSDPSGTHCLQREACCSQGVPENRFCYRAQCFATTRALTQALELEADRVGTAFQSRLGRTPWIRPFTDEVLPELRSRGVKRLAVMTPSFVADCLETLEEIGIRAAEQWRSLGGDDLRLVTSLNAEPVWVNALAQILAPHVR